MSELGSAASGAPDGGLESLFDHVLIRLGVAFYRSPGWLGVRVRKLYVSLRSPDHKPLFSERNRVKCRVLPLRRGWRIVARYDG